MSNKQHWFMKTRSCQTNVCLDTVTKLTDEWKADNVIDLDFLDMS